MCIYLLGPVCYFSPLFSRNNESFLREELEYGRKQHRAGLGQTKKNKNLNMGELYEVDQVGKLVPQED